MQKKTFFLIILSFILILNLVSCSQKSQSMQNPQNANPTATSSQESKEESDGAAAIEPKPVRAEENQKSTLEMQVDSYKLEENKRAVDLYEKGLKLYYDRKFTEALDLFNQALAIDPKNHQALNAKGATYAFQGRYDEGISLIQTAIQIKPEFVYAHFNLGLAYELARNYDKSIEAYKEALKLDEKDVWSYFGIASIYGRQGNVEKVIEWLRPAIALDPEVKTVAREEKDFNPVKGDPRFLSLIK